jgi:hypothetical protein
MVTTSRIVSGDESNFANVNFENRRRVDEPGCDE